MNITKLFSARLAVFIITAILTAAMCIAACKKEQQINLTGTWCTLVPLELYYFTDMSVFSQATRTGEQWIYDQRGNEIKFFGTPDRTWRIIYALEDEFQVVEFETDTLTLFRK